MAPIIIACATMVSRRWGESIGGLMVGLPLTSAPVSIFFAIEQGPHFAASAAQGAMLGLIPVSIFCAVYARAASRFSWPITALISIGMYGVSVWVSSSFSPGLITILVIVSLALILSWLVIGKQPQAERPILPPWWDLPLRMVISAALLVLITTLAGTLGPKWSGLLSPFPIFTFVMAAFSHSQSGPLAARRVIHGVVSGLFAYLAFFLVVTLFIEHMNLVVVYFLSALVAVGLNGFWLFLLVTRQANQQNG